ncbi:MAG TPA: hypothetical protein VJP77_01805 [Planctomycetota bacterium]|nr:hypothetical protein [Planctomycetota bacterium]
MKQNSPPRSGPHTVLVFAGLLGACAVHPGAPFDPTQSTEMVVLADGQVISGRIEARRITVPEGATVRYEGDTTLHAEWICVHGTLVGDSPYADGPPRGVGPDDLDFAPGTLRLEATREIHISPRAVWLGGDAPDMYGWSEAFYGVDAADGGSLELLAPSILDDGQLTAGDGGDAAPGGDGGTGGGVFWRGERRYVERAGEVRGGSGGRAGPGGNLVREDGTLYPEVEAGFPGAGGSLGQLPEDIAEVVSPR